METKMQLKKIFISIVIIFIICLIILGGYFLYKYNTPTKLTSLDNSFTIMIPGKVNFKIKEAKDTDYKLDIYSVKDEMTFYSVGFEKTGEINLLDAVNIERNDISKSEKNVRDMSEAINLNINNYNSYKYSYIYYDSNFNSDIYTEIVWIETPQNVYVLDFEVVTKNMEKYKPIFSDIYNSFIIL